jgi:hypothetical protein
LDRSIQFSPVGEKLVTVYHTGARQFPSFGFCCSAVDAGQLDVPASDERQGVLETVRLDWARLTDRFRLLDLPIEVWAWCGKERF